MIYDKLVGKYKKIGPLTKPQLSFTCIDIFLKYPQSKDVIIWSVGYLILIRLLTNLLSFIKIFTL